MKRLFIALSVIAAIMVITCLALDAPPMLYLILLGILVVVYFITAPIYREASKLQTDGKIITRGANFMENAQTFVLSKVSIETVISAMKNEGLPFAGLEWKTGNDAMGFRYSGWAAQMVRLDSDDNRDKFKFSFTGWQTMRYGAAVNITQMNQLLTAIEKAFITLDSGTKVQTERIRVQTKNSFF